MNEPRKKFSKTSNISKSKSKTKSEDDVGPLTLQVDGKSCLQNKKPLPDRDRKNVVSSPKSLAEMSKSEKSSSSFSLPEKDFEDMDLLSDEQPTHFASVDEKKERVISPASNQCLDEKIFQLSVETVKGKLQEISKAMEKQVESEKKCLNSEEIMCNVSSVYVDTQSVLDNLEKMLDEVEKNHELKLNKEKERQIDLESRIVVLESQLVGKDELERGLKLEMEKLTEQVLVLNAQKDSWSELEKNFLSQIKLYEEELKKREERCKEKLEDLMAEKVGNETLLKANLEVAEEEISKRQKEWFHHLDLEEAPISMPDEENLNFSITNLADIPEEMFKELTDQKKEFQNLDEIDVCLHLPDDLESTKKLFDTHWKETSELKPDKSLLELKKMIATLEEKVVVKEQEVMEVPELKIQLARLEAEKEMLKEEKAQLEKSLVETDTNFKNSEALCEENMEKIFELEKEKEDVLARNMVLEKTNKELSLKVEQQRRGLTEEQSVKEKYLKELEEMQVKMQEMERREQEHLEAIDLCRKQLQEVTAERDWLRDEKVALIRTKKSAEEKVKMLSEQLEEKDRVKSQEAGRNEESLSKLKTEIEELLKEKNRLAEENLRLKEEQGKTQVSNEPEDQLALPVIAETSSSSTRATIAIVDETSYFDLPNSTLNNSQVRYLQKEIQEVWSDRLQVEEQLTKVQAENRGLLKRIEKQEAASRKMVALIDGGVPSAATWLQLYENVREVVADLALRSSKQQSEVTESESTFEEKINLRGEPEGSMLPEPIADSDQNQIGKKIVKELIRYMGQCEDELNQSLFNDTDEKIRITPDLSDLDLSRAQIELEKCLQHVKGEASRLLKLSKKADEAKTLEMQLVAADNQVKSTRRFLEEQAAEVESERDEYTKQISDLKEALKNERKKTGQYEQLIQDHKTLEEQFFEKVNELGEKESLLAEEEKQKKEAIEKVWTLRDIIQELENQLANKSEENVALKLQIEQLKGELGKLGIIYEERESLQRDSQTELAAHVERLQVEVASLRSQIAASSPELIQSAISVLHQMENHLVSRTREVELALLGPSATNASSASEDLSHFAAGDATRCQTPDEMAGPVLIRVFDDTLYHFKDRLNKHFRTEEALLRKVIDLDLKHLNVEEILGERDLAMHRIEELMEDIAELKGQVEGFRMREQEEIEKRKRDQSNQTSFSERRVQFSAPDSFMPSISSIHLESSDSVERCTPHWSDNLNRFCQQEISALNLSPRAVLTDLSIVGSASLPAGCDDITQKELVSSEVQCDLISQCCNCSSGKFQILLPIFETTVEKMQQIMKQLDNRLCEKDEKLKQLTANIVALKEQKIEQVSRQLAEMTTDAEMKTEELNLAHSEIVSLRKKVKLLGEELTGEREAKSALEEQLKQLQDQYQLEMETNAEAKVLNSLQEMELETLKGHVIDMENQLQETTIAFNSRKASTEFLKGELLSTSLNLNDLKTKNEELEESNAKIVRKLEDLNSEWVKAKEVCEEIRQANGELRKEGDLLNKEKSELRAALLEKSAAFVSLQSDLNDVKLQYQKKMGENQELVTIVEHLNSLQKDAQRELEEKRIEIRKLKDKQDNALQSMKQQLESYFAKIALLEANLEEEFNVRFKAVEEVEDLRRNNADLANELAVVRAKQRKSQCEVTSLRDKLTASNKNYMMMNERAVSAEDQVDKFRQENAILNDKMEFLGAEVNRLKYQAETHAMELRAMAGFQQCESVFQSFHQPENSDVKDKLRWQRAESYRKALIWQKRYLLAVIKKHPRRRRTRTPKFREVVIVVIAIYRMRFLVRRWKNKVSSTLPRILNVPSTSKDVILPSVLSPPSKDPGLQVF